VKPQAGPKLTGKAALTAAGAKITSGTTSRSPSTPTDASEVSSQFPALSAGFCELTRVEHRGEALSGLVVAAGTA
jgi:hypothetical protein